MSPDRHRQHTKLQRWTDLLAALLSRRLGATFSELAGDVPAYAHGPADKDSIKRTFERDKDELRELGIAIETLGADDDNETRYRLRPTDFYLPYLALEGAEAAHEPRPEGYRAIPAATLSPYDLSLIGDAVARLQQLGDPLLAEDARSAANKLAFDLPLIDHVASDVRLIDADHSTDENAFDALTEALRRRKVVAFTYNKPGANEPTDRRVEPYGLCFINASWYLVGRDRTRAALRSFRLSRISGVDVNRKKPQTPDFDVPADFQLRDHARAREAWDLGDAEPLYAEVRFSSASGATEAAARIGEPVAGDPTLRRYPVRRLDTFARWLLALGGDARPLSPPELVDLYQRAARDTLKRLNTASAQLKRLLALIPEIADGGEHAVADVAGRLGVDADTVARDLHTLSERFGDPPGWIEKVQVYLEADRVSVEAPTHFRRPIRLTPSEVKALELGLALLSVERPKEHAAIDGTRERIRSLASGEVPDTADRAASLGLERNLAHVPALRDALRNRRQVAIHYRKGAATESERRVVCPLSFAVEKGMWYLVAHCSKSEAIRIFRVDRIEGIELLWESFERPEVDVDRLFADRAAFVGTPPRSLKVRYSPKVARWIAERDEGTWLADGRYQAEYPLADVDWAVRHVLQYGPEAEVIEPADVRAAVVERLQRALR